MKKTDEYIKVLKQRADMLQSLILSKQKSIPNSPAGKVQCVKHGKKYAYYIRTKSVKNGDYIPVDNHLLALRLAQREYDERLLKPLQKELKSLTTYLNYCSTDTLDKVYSRLPKSKQELVTPYELSDDDFVAKWLNEEYKPLNFKEGDPEYYSAQDERMRSKSEVLIADTLHRFGVLYKYEKPLDLINGRTVYPDFTILDLKRRKEIYWEHFEKMSDSTYVSRTLWKIKEYELSGFRLGEDLYATFESEDQALDTRIVEIYAKQISTGVY